MEAIWIKARECDILIVSIRTVTISSFINTTNIDIYAGAYEKVKASCNSFEDTITGLVHFMS